MKDRWLLRFHEDLEACVTRIVDAMQITWTCGCKLGKVDVSSVILRYLWQKSLVKRPAVFNANSCENAIQEVEATLLPLITYKVESIKE